MFAYSAIKIRANSPPENSVLNPDTNSDSPSARSNGVRLVSAKFVMNHIIKMGIFINIIQEVMWFDIVCISIVKIIIILDNKIMDMDTSYEIVCATPRNDPSKEYLELDLQPEIKITYTFILETHKKYNTPNKII